MSQEALRDVIRNLIQEILESDVSCPECKGVGLVENENSEFHRDKYIICPTCDGKQLGWVKEEKDEDDIDENSSTGNVAGYNVPGAFSGDPAAKGKKKQGRHGKASTKEGGCPKPDVLGYTIVEGKKRFNVQQDIGKSKYVINFHDGKQKHKDGSDFFDIKILKNKEDLASAVKDLKTKGYVSESIIEANSKDRRLEYIKDEIENLHWKVGLAKKEVLNNPKKSASYIKDALNMISDIQKRFNYYFTDSKVFEANDPSSPSKARISALQRRLRETGVRLETAADALSLPTTEWKIAKREIDTVSFAMKDIIKQINWLVHRSPEAMTHDQRESVIENLSENRWLQLKQDESLNPVQKIGIGVRRLNGQLKEIEDFTRWFKRLQVENDLESDQHWKRTQRNVKRMKERIVRIAKDIMEMT